MLLRCLLAGIFLCISTIAVAHGGGQHVLGTVTAIDDKHIEVKTPKGAIVSVTLTKQTRFKEKGNPKSTGSPAVGDRVVIEASKDANVLIATEVHYAAAKQAPATP